MARLQTARIQAARVIDGEMRAGTIDVVEASGRLARVERILEFGRSSCERDMKLPESTAVALRRWARLRRTSRSQEGDQKRDKQRQRTVHGVGRMLAPPGRAGWPPRPGRVAVVAAAAGSGAWGTGPRRRCS